MNQSDKIDELLKKIAQEIDYSEVSYYNFDTKIESDEYRKLLIILCNENLIAKTFTNSTTFHITSHGNRVLNSGGWKNYQKIEKEKEERKERKENLDLKISEFQVKTKWLPYWISFISLGISLLAYYESNKKPITEKKIENKSINDSLKIDSTQNVIKVKQKPL